MFSEKNGWCVPIMTMEESERSRASKKSECRERKSLLTELYHCKKCNTVYQGALSAKKISTGGKYKRRSLFIIRYANNIFRKKGMFKMQIIMPIFMLLGVFVVAIGLLFIIDEFLKEYHKRKFGGEDD